jgi:hypothetical protein
VLGRVPPLRSPTAALVAPAARFAGRLSAARRVLRSSRLRRQRPGRPAPPPGGSYLAWEIKSAERAAPADARHLRRLASLLDGPLLAGLVIHLGDRVGAWPDAIFGVPAAARFAAAAATAGGSYTPR